jgi:L-fuconolactonase
VSRVPGVCSNALSQLCIGRIQQNLIEIKPAGLYSRAEMRIDAHHHFWEIGRYTYPWMDESSRVWRHFAPSDFEPLLQEHRIDRSILVQTICSVPETRWFLDLADRHPFIGGVVGWVDLTDLQVSATLEEFIRHPKFAGIRHPVHDELDPCWLLRPDVQGGLAALERRHIPYDLLIRSEHLQPSLEVARKFSELPLVIDHIAKPDIRTKAWDDWAPGMKELSECPNVYCKLSGMITEADWDQWKPEDLRPYIRHVIDCFGPRRVMFGSDWPVCLLAGSYDRMIEALEVNLSDLPADELEAIFGGTAADFYEVS